MDKMARVCPAFQDQKILKFYCRLGLLPILYKVAVILQIIVFTVIFIVGFLGGVSGILTSLFIVPFWAVCNFFLTRVFAEFLASTLLLPHLIAQQQHTLTVMQTQNAFAPQIPPTYEPQV